MAAREALRGRLVLAHAHQPLERSRPRVESRRDSEVRLDEDSPVGIERQARVRARGRPVRRPRLERGGDEGPPHGHHGEGLLLARRAFVGGDPELRLARRRRERDVDAPSARQRLADHVRAREPLPRRLVELAHAGGPTPSDGRLLGRVGVHAGVAVEPEDATPSGADDEQREEAAAHGGVARRGVGAALARGEQELLVEERREDEVAVARDRARGQRPRRRDVVVVLGEPAFELGGVGVHHDDARAVGGKDGPPHVRRDRAGRGRARRRLVPSRESVRREEVGDRAFGRPAALERGVARPPRLDPFADERDRAEHGGVGGDLGVEPVARAPQLVRRSVEVARAHQRDRAAQPGPRGASACLARPEDREPTCQTVEARRGQLVRRLEGSGRQPLGREDRVGHEGIPIEETLVVVGPSRALRRERRDLGGRQLLLQVPGQPPREAPRGVAQGLEADLLAALDGDLEQKVAGGVLRLARRARPRHATEERLEVRDDAVVARGDLALDRLDEVAIFERCQLGLGRGSGLGASHARARDEGARREDRPRRGSPGLALAETAPH